MVAYASGNEEEATVIYETSFENATDSQWLKSGITSYDKTDRYSGTQSLKYVMVNNTGPTMRFNVTPGASYDVTVWAKTTELTLDSGTGRAGARVALDAFTADNTWQLGSYMHSVDTKGEWKQLKLPTFIPNEQTTSTEIALYSEGQGGVIWFDDLVITETKPKIVSSRMITPAYRGIIHPESNEPIKIRLQGMPGISEALYTTSVRLLDEDDSIIEENEYANQLTLDAAFATDELEPGTYKVVVSVSSNLTETEAYSRAWSIYKAESVEELPESYVDDQGRFWKDGQLFFPIGIYTANTVAEDLFDLKNSAINTILPYDYPDLAKLDLANEYGINVIFSFKDFFYGFPFAPDTIRSVEDEAVQITEFVNRYKNHPALLAWYLSDETIADSRLATHYQTVVENDRNHPAYVVDFQLQDYFTIGETSDVFGLDVYPVFGHENDDIKLVGELQKQVTEELASKGQWAIIQAHNMNNYPSNLNPLRGPTGDEMRNMAWQYVTEGARGVIFYSMFDLRQDVSGKTYNELFASVSTVAQELENMTPVIFSDEPTADFGGLSQEWLHTMVKSYNGNQYLIAVNNSNEVQQATFTSEQSSGAPIRVWSEQRSINWNGNQFSDSFAPYAVHIYEIGEGASIAEPHVPQWEADSQLTISNMQATSVALSWPEAKSDVAGYRVYRNEQLIAEVGQETLNYTVDGLTGNTNYQFHVTAINDLGNESNGLSKSATTTAAGTGGGYPVAILSNNAQLSKLEVKAGEQTIEITPVFNSDRLSYSGEVKSEEAEIIAAAAHPKASLKYKGEIVQGSVKVSIKPGDNAFELLVQAEDGTTKTYTLTLHRSTDTESELSNPSDPTDPVVLIDIDGHWAESALRKAVSLGITTGYTDGTFRPNQPITRAEFIVMLMKYLKQHETEAELSFTDADQIGKWAREGIARAVQAGIINGDENGRFLPDRKITRAEMAVILFRAMQASADGIQTTGFSDDSAIPKWAKSAVTSLHSLGILNGRSNNKFAPNEPLTRAEAIVAMLRMQ